MTGLVLGMVIGIMGMSCLAVGLKRRHTERRDTLLVLYVGGLALVLAGMATVVS